MDINSLADKLVALLGAIGSLAWVLQRIHHAKIADDSAKEIDRQQWEDRIMQQVKLNAEDAMKNMEDRYQQLATDLDKLTKAKDAMEQQLTQQIALKEEENKNLRKTNDELKREINIYRSKYGRLRR